MKIIYYNDFMKKPIISLALLFIVHNVFSQDFSRTIELRNDRMHGADIARLQTRLKFFGFDEIGECDSYYGPLTENAIKTIQSFSGFEQNGKVDRKLWEFIFTESNISLIENINRVSKYDIDILEKDSGDRSGYSTEGGHVDKYYSNNEIKVIKLFLYGEQGRVEYNFYYINSNEYFLITKDYIYAEYLFSYLHEQAETGEYVFDNESFERDTKIEYETYLKSDTDLFQIINGDMVKANIDLDELIDIIEDEEPD
jgi:peptidoglycan hydrolase-like protein with peptidoglycan-binding domain